MTDARYLAGTLVLLSSFLRQNSWFNGEIVIIHDDLPLRLKNRLTPFPNVAFRQVSAALKCRLEETVRILPQLANSQSRFFALEAFNLAGRKRVLFLDSDMLCRGSVEELFSTEAGLLACPDQSYYRNQVRDYSTFLRLDKDAAVESDRVLEVCFNAGFLLIGRQHLGSAVFAELVHSIQARTWETIQSGHTDQVVFNRYFEGRWTLVAGKYNYLISKDMSAYTRIGEPLDEAVLLHYLGRPKPWEPQGVIASERMESCRRTAFHLWHEAWRTYALGCLKERRDAAPMVRLAVMKLLRGLAWIRKPFGR